MRSSRTESFHAGSVALILAASLLLTLPGKPARAGDAEVEHGRYVVQQVSMCVDCHGSALTGGHVGHNPAAPLAPPIAGLPGLDAEAVATFLQTGKLNGAAVPPPMPAYRMHADDAHAVATYLKSLPAATPASTTATAPASSASP